MPGTAIFTYKDQRFEVSADQPFSRAVDQARAKFSVAKCNIYNNGDRVRKETAPTSGAYAGQEYKIVPTSRVNSDWGR